MVIIFFGGKDLIELENRNFVIAIGLDKNKKNDFELDILESDFDFFDKENSDNEKNVKVGIEKNFAGALKKIEEKSEKKIYLGHAQIIFMANKFKQDKFFLKKIINELAKKNFVNQKIKIMFVDEPKKIICQKFDSKFINFIRNKSHSKKFITLHDLYEKINIRG